MNSTKDEGSVQNTYLSKAICNLEHKNHAKDQAGTALSSSGTAATGPGRQGQGWLEVASGVATQSDSAARQLAELGACFQEAKTARGRGLPFLQADALCTGCMTATGCRCLSQSTAPSPSSARHIVWWPRCKSPGPTKVSESESADELWVDAGHVGHVSTTRGQRPLRV